MIAIRDVQAAPPAQDSLVAVVRVAAASLPAFPDASFWYDQRSVCEPAVMGKFTVEKATSPDHAPCSTLSM